MTQMSIEQAVLFGLEHHRSGRFREAESIYRQILAVQPDHPDALHLLGALALEANQPQLAAELIQKAISLRPYVPEFYWNFGRALAGLGRWADAVNAYRQALSQKQDSAELCNDLGNALLISGRWAEAVGAYERAIAIAPQYADAWNNLGAALTELQQHSASIPALRKAIELRPEYPEAWNNLGNALQANGELEESLDAYRRAIAQRPTYAPAHNNLGSALRLLDRFDDAVTHFQKAIELNPQFANAHNSLGTAMLDRNDLDQAKASYQQAISLQPNFAEAHYNLGRLMLLRGDMPSGWNEYEWRWGMKEVATTYQQLRQPIWDGSDLAGKTILLHAEQGFGDTIQFIRFAKQAKQRGARVIVAAQKELGRILSTCDGIDELITEGQPLPAFDIRCPLLSLPRVLQTKLDALSAESPYLHADQSLVASWKDRLANANGALRVGLVWSGRKTFRDDRWRSLKFDQLAPFFEIPSVHFFSLQIGGPSDERLTDLSKELHDFADTAAVLKNLDLLITSDTAAAHLAGALACPVWVMLPFAPDWRWLLGREDSPWYPSMRLFRQPGRGDWAGVIDRVSQELRNRSEQP